MTTAYLFDKIRQKYYNQKFQVLVNVSFYQCCFNSCVNSKEPIDFEIETIELLEETKDSFDEALEELTELTQNKNCWTRISINWRRQLLITIKVIITIFLSISNCDVIPDTFVEWNLTFFIKNNWVLIVLWLIVNSVYVYYQFYREYRSKLNAIFMFVILFLTFLTTFVCKTNITWPPAVVCFIMYISFIGLLSLWGILMYYIPKSRKLFCNNYTEDQIKAFIL